jgi:hypothetical protein
MKKSLIILIALFLLTLTLVTASVEEIKDTRYDWRTTQKEVTIPLSIEYIEGIGGNTEELVVLQTDFNTKVSERAPAQELKVIINEARTIIKAESAANGGDLEELRATLDAALESDENVLAAFETYKDALRSHASDRFHKHADRMQRVVDRAQERSPDVDVSSLQTLVDEMNTYPDQFVEAADDRETLELLREEVKVVNENFKNTYRELFPDVGQRQLAPSREEIKDKFGKRARKAIEKRAESLEEVVEEIEEIVEEESEEEESEEEESEEEESEDEEVEEFVNESI